MDRDPQELVPSRFPMGTQETEEKEEDKIKEEGQSMHQLKDVGMCQ